LTVFDGNSWFFVALLTPNQSGLVAGPVALVLIGILSLYTMRLMLECKHKVQ
jgi:hypothetical protein